MSCNSSAWLVTNVLPLSGGTSVTTATHWEDPSCALFYCYGQFSLNKKALPRPFHQWVSQNPYFYPLTHNKIKPFYCPHTFGDNKCQFHFLHWTTKSFCKFPIFKSYIEIKICNTMAEMSILWIEVYWSHCTNDDEKWYKEMAIVMHFVL